LKSVFFSKASVSEGITLPNGGVINGGNGGSIAKQSSTTQKPNVRHLLRRALSASTPIGVELKPALPRGGLADRPALVWRRRDVLARSSNCSFLTNTDQIRVDWSTCRAVMRRSGSQLEPRVISEVKRLGGYLASS
jgi:hypothetical protein